MLPSDNLMSLVLTLLLALAVSVWWGWQRGRRRTLPVLVQLDNKKIVNVAWVRHAEWMPASSEDDTPLDALWVQFDGGDDGGKTFIGADAVRLWALLCARAERPQ